MKKNVGKNEKFAQKLRENCAENALKLCAQIVSHCAQVARKLSCKIR